VPLLVATSASYLTATFGSWAEYSSVYNLSSTVVTLAVRYDAEVATSSGTNYTSWYEWNNYPVPQESVYPITMTVKVPYVRVMNSLPHAVLLQQAGTTLCHRLAPGAAQSLPLAASGVAMFDAFISLGGGYWIREANANCSTVCTDCFWWWTDHDRPFGAFLAKLGFGPGFFGPFLRPRSYAGISELELRAERWTLGGVDTGIEDIGDWDELGYSGATALNEVVTVNCSVGSPYCGIPIKPFRVAEIEILGETRQPSQPTFEPTYDQDITAGRQHEGVSAILLLSIVLLGASFLAAFAVSRYWHRWSGRADGTAPCTDDAEQTRRLTAP